MNAHLEQFKKLNSSIEIKEETEHYNIERLWGDSSFMFRQQKNEDFSSLGNIELPLELSAIYHKDEQKLEFIFSPLRTNEPYLSRKTIFYYNGIEFETEFNNPSNALKIISKGFRETDTNSETNYRNLRVFRDFYNIEQQSNYLKQYFKDKEPYSFYIKGDFKKIKNDLLPFCKHLNVYLKFFDRKAPIIAIHNIEPKSETFNLPCHSEKNTFPEQIFTTQIDPIALDLLHIANETGGSRLKYLFYYQVLEYFAYHYLDEEIKRKLSNILKSPDILHNSSNYSRVIIEELKDYTNNTSDKHKLTKLIGDYLTIDDISLEIMCNIDFFKKDIEFEGGFKLSSLVTDENIFVKLGTKETKEKKKDRERIKSDLINTVIDRIERIRNVLVHIRESRENKVIFPTRKNNRSLIPYLYLIRRIAETISIKYKI